MCSFFSSLVWSLRLVRVVCGLVCVVCDMLCDLCGLGHMVCGMWSGMWWAVGFTEPFS